MNQRSLLSLIETAVALALMVWWSLGYLAAEDNINQLGLTQRAARFAIYATDERLTIGYVLGLLALGVLGARRLVPTNLQTPLFVGSAALAAAASWGWPLITKESLAMIAAVAIGAFFVTRATKQWLVFPVGAAAVVIAALPWFEVDRQLSYLNEDSANPWLRLTVSVAAVAIGVIGGRVLVQEPVAQTPMIEHGTDETLSGHQAASRDEPLP